MKRMQTLYHVHLSRGRNGVVFFLLGALILTLFSMIQKIILVGKIGIPDSILNKPAALTANEMKIMVQHPKQAYDMLSHIGFLGPALEIPYCHHEHWDGSGYPRGLKGEEIPLAARIFAVVDVWDALTSDRPYRAAWTEQEALTYIREQSGKYFDPAVVKTFLDNFSALMT